MAQMPNSQTANPGTRGVESTVRLHFSGMRAPTTRVFKAPGQVSNY